MRVLSKIRDFYKKFMEKYPTKNAEGLEIPKSVNILILTQMFAISFSFLFLVDFNISFQTGLNPFIYLIIVFIFSAYYRSISIKAGRDILVYNASEFIVISSIVLFNNFVITLFTITLYIFSHFLFGLRNPHQLVFNYANTLLSGTIVHYLYNTFVKDLISVSDIFLILGGYILVITFYILNNLQTILVVSLVSEETFIEIIMHHFKIGEEFYIIVVSASAIIFTILTPSLYPIIFVLIFLLFIQQIKKEKEIKNHHESKIELKQLQHEQEVKQLKLKKFEALQILSGKVAHDIKNYLTILSGNFQLIQQSNNLDEKRTDQINKAISNIDEIIIELLDFSKPEKMNLQRVYLNEFVQEVAELVLLNSGISYNINSSQTDLIVKIDRIKMTQVLSNILINAIEATDNENGNIIVTTEPAQVDGKLLGKIIIQDNGHGIPENIQNRIFEPYYSTKEEGSGLGLAKANSIIQAHSGSISFFSSSDQGTKFEIFIPVQNNLII